jgi:hypothetical protein
MLFFNAVILAFGFDREGLKVVYNITLVTYYASGRDTRVSVSISKKKINQETWHTKGSARWSNWHSSLSYQGRARAGHCFDIRHVLYHYTVLWRDGMDSVTLISFPFDCQCNVQVDSIGGLWHMCCVLFLYCRVEIHYIIKQFVRWDEKTGYAVIMLQFEALLSFW